LPRQLFPKFQLDFFILKMNTYGIKQRRAFRSFFLTKCDFTHIWQLPLKISGVDLPTYATLFKQQGLGFRHKVHVFFMKVELIF